MATYTEFDIDELDELKQFAEELKNVGCNIKEIGSALQHQPHALKEKNWNAVATKEELSTFVEIYTVILSIVIYALKSNHISYKPSQSCVKALTMKVTTKLPQQNDTPILTQYAYANTLHNIFREIHDEIDNNPMRSVVGKSNKLKPSTLQQSLLSEGAPQQEVQMAIKPVQNIETQETQIVIEPEHPNYDQVDESDEPDDIYDNPIILYLLAAVACILPVFGLLGVCAYFCGRGLGPRQAKAYRRMCFATVFGLLLGNLVNICVYGWSDPQSGIILLGSFVYGICILATICNCEPY